MSNRHIVALTDREQFFYDYAGYSYDPERESVTSGRVRNAVLLAQAERIATQRDWTPQWDIDPDADTEPTDTYFVSGADHWICTVTADDGRRADLCSIDLGFDKYPETDPYAKVVEAELYFELIYGR